MNQMSSHVEMVEIIGIINWLRQTKTFYKELNDNLQARYNQFLVAIFKTNPIEKVSFLIYLIEHYGQSHNVVQCHSTTFP